MLAMFGSVDEGDEGEPAVVIYGQTITRYDEEGFVRTLPAAPSHWLTWTDGPYFAEPAEADRRARAIVGLKARA